MTNAPSTALDLARHYISSLKAQRPTCERCDFMSAQAAKRPGAKMHGTWEPCPTRSGFIRRCMQCQHGVQHPWAWQLRPEAVAKMITQDPRFRAGEVTSLEVLRELVEEIPDESA